jgi:hypothetical protein
VFPLTPSVKSYAVNGRNQYTLVGGTIHPWDANGSRAPSGHDFNPALLGRARFGRAARKPLQRIQRSGSGSAFRRSGSG